jgi:hypothetical protein
MLMLRIISPCFGSHRPVGPWLKPGSAGLVLVSADFHARLGQLMNRL